MDSSNDITPAVETTEPSPKQKPDFSSGPRPLTQQEIDSLRKSKQEAHKAHVAYFKTLK